MKKILKTIAAFCGAFSFITTVHAAGSVFISSSANYIEAGNRVTFYIRLNNVAAWDLSGQGYGSTANCTLGDQGVGDSGTGANINKTLTVTCVSTSVGQVAFQVVGNVSSANGQNIDKVAINTSKTVTITAPREKDSNNYLKSLNVKDYKISPEFNKDTMEYTVDVPSTINKVKIEAQVVSGYASLSNPGEVEVNEGANSFEIKVVSETGIERIYKLTVNVKDENPIKVKIDDSTYTIMKNAKTIEIPSTYEETKVKINDIEVPAFYSDVTKFTLVGVKDQKGKKYLAIYNSKEKNYQLYNENKSDQLLLYIEKIPENLSGFIKENVVINNISYDCLKKENSKTILIYAMNIINGKEDYYIYDKELNSYTKYDPSFFEHVEKELEKYKKTIIIFGGIIIFAMFIIIILLIRKPKKIKNKKKVMEEIKINQLNKEQTAEEKPKSKKENKKTPKNSESHQEKKKINTKEEAMKKVEDVTSMIDEFEKTGVLKKEELEKIKEQSNQEIEETMYNSN